MDSAFLWTTIIGSIVGLVVLYFVIRFAVFDAMRSHTEWAEARAARRVQADLPGTQ